MQFNEEALSWPDNRPIYDVPSQAPFLVEPVTFLHHSDPFVQMLRAGSVEEVR